MYSIIIIARQRLQQASTTRQRQSLQHDKTTNFLYIFFLFRLSRSRTKSTKFYNFKIKKSLKKRLNYKKKLIKMKNEKCLLC